MLKDRGTLGEASLALKPRNPKALSAAQRAPTFHESSAPLCGHEGIGHKQITPGPNDKSRSLRADWA